MNISLQQICYLTNIWSHKQDDTDCLSVCLLVARSGMQQKNKQHEHRQFKYTAAEMRLVHNASVAHGWPEVTHGFIFVASIGYF